MPKFLKNYFWDVEFSLMNKDRDRIFIAERILNLGRIEGFSWLVNNYGIEELLNITKINPNISNTAKSLLKALIS